MNQLDLNGRVAVVTGGARGIGRAIAERMIASGATVALWDLDEPAAQQTAAALGERASVDRVDQTDEAGVRAATAAAVRRHGGIDILVNNAGIIHRADAEEHSLAGLREVFAVNLDSLFELSRAVARPMLERRSGKIINIASVLTFQGGVRVSGYTASKHAVAGLTKAWANEWAGRNVQVNAIAARGRRAIPADPGPHSRWPLGIPR
jgi:2-deoxy-D-gluconate 3-dehydrogenase